MTYQQTAAIPIATNAGAEVLSKKIGPMIGILLNIGTSIFPKLCLI